MYEPQQSQQRTHRIVCDELGLALHQVAHFGSSDDKLAGFALVGDDGPDVSVRSDN